MRPPLRNLLLAGLPPAEWAALEPHLEPVPLPFGAVVHDPLRPIPAVYFPEEGVVSLLSVMADGSAVETGTVGYEGMAGMAVFHGADVAPEQAYIQVGGHGHRIATDAFRAAIAEAPTLAASLSRYAQALYTLAAQTSGCNRKHSMEQRCARWLLLTHDRVGRDEFEITQVVLSQMLGVRRATVTEAAGALQQAGAIRYSRGRVVVADRARLEALCCECYAIIRSYFDRLLGDGRTPSPLEHVRVSEDGRSTATGAERDTEPVAESVSA